MYILMRSSGRYEDYSNEPIAVSHDKDNLEALALTKAANDKLAGEIRKEIGKEAEHIHIDRPFNAKPPKTVKEIGERAHNEACLDYNRQQNNWWVKINQEATGKVLEQHNLPADFLDTVCSPYESYGIEYSVEEIEEI